MLSNSKLRHEVVGPKHITVGGRKTMIQMIRNSIYRIYTIYINKNIKTYTLSHDKRTEQVRKTRGKELQTATECTVEVE